MSKLNVLDILEVDLEKVIKFAQNYLSADKGVKKNIIKYIADVEKIYNKLIENTIPFYEILYNDKNFEEKFPIQYAKFMSAYSYNRRDYFYSCLRVQEGISVLEKKKRYFQKNNINKDYLDSPLFRNYDLSTAIDTALDDFERHLREISSKMKQGEYTESRKQLQLFTDDTRPTFKHIQRLLVDLENLKWKLDS